VIAGRPAERYALQDQVLRTVSRLDTGFYLTGGAAAARGYLNHREEETLVLAVSDDRHFGGWAEAVVGALRATPGWTVEGGPPEPRFVGLAVQGPGSRVRLKLVSEMFPHMGQIVTHPVLGRLSSALNLTADLVIDLLDVAEPTDLADLWGFCVREGRPVVDALDAARRKGATVFPIDLARVLAGAGRAEWELVTWVSGPTPDRYLEDLRRLAEELLLLKA